MNTCLVRRYSKHGQKDILNDAKMQTASLFF